MTKDAEKYNIPCVKPWSSQQLGIDLSKASHQDFSSFYHEIKKAKDVEGFVIRFSDGRMYKIKTNWYFEVNHALDHLKNEKNERHKWEAILREQYDDLRIHLTPTMQDAMDKFATALINQLTVTAKRCLAKVKEMKQQKMDRKEFSTKIAPLKSEKAVYFQIWSDLEGSASNSKEEESEKEDEKLTQKTVDFVKELLIKNLGGKSQFEDIVKNLMDGLTWASFRPKIDKKEYNPLLDDGE